MHTTTRFAVPALAGLLIFSGLAAAPGAVWVDGRERGPYYGDRYYHHGWYGRPYHRGWAYPYARPYGYGEGVWIPGPWRWRAGVRIWVPGHWR